MDNVELKKKIIAFANENPNCHLATLDGDQPRVRGMLMWFADETGFYFHTGSTKKLAAQVKNGTRAEAAFPKATQNMAELQELRVSGHTEVVNDKTLEERLFKERPWLLQNVKAVPGATVVIFKICNGEAFLWNFGVNCKEHTAPRVAI
jgi:pyridoxamine 5'-phosphate oxidase